jgi:hypothetical protein
MTTSLIRADEIYEQQKAEKKMTKSHFFDPDSGLAGSGLAESGLAWQQGRLEIWCSPQP